MDWSVVVHSLKIRGHSSPDAGRPNRRGERLGRGWGRGELQSAGPEAKVTLALWVAPDWLVQFRVTLSSG